MGRLRDLDPPTGEQLRKVFRYEHDRVGDLVHIDVKKVGRTATGTGKVGYTYLHSALEDHSRLAMHRGPGR
ncbi:hypothetical protein [Streptomyces sp. MUM 16J]|uniref:hypothetical protein n=1 Tax=Streptomyces sp. MUM 16J TaxID=2791988 RepID=UPI00069EDD70|nr:hypothetical protein [Streptomyces sp. MUM 16J]MCH0558443.1 hypothetical protein [Streptomyces sp. MUM 16J]